MDITIHFSSDKGVHREKYDCGRPSKSRVGPRPLTMSHSIVLNGLKDRLDIRLKGHIERLIAANPHFKGDKCSVYINHPDLLTPSERITTFNVRNPKDFSNKLVKYILVTSKGHTKDSHDNACEENTMSLIK